MTRVANEGATDVGICEGTTWATQMSSYNIGPILLLEIDFPDGAQYFAKESIRFVNRHYSGRIVNLGSFRRAIQQNLGLFEATSVDVNLADTDLSLIDSSSDRNIKGVLARFKLGDRKLPLATYETIFEGLIDDFGAQNFTFRILVRDKLYTLPPKPITGFVNTDDFPNALPADIGKPLPVCYGTHTDNGTDDAKNRGAWPTLFVDVQTAERTFLIARHAVKSIDEVYAYNSGAGSQLLVNNTDYVAYKNGLLNGETMAFVQLTTTGFNKLVDVNVLGTLTVNVQGKEDVGDGSGTLIDNPIAILRDFIGNYLGSPTINGEIFSAQEANANTRGYEASGGYTKEKGTDEFLKELCDSFQIRLFPDRNGKIACNLFVPKSPLTSGLAVRDQWEILKGTFEVDFRSDVQGAEDAHIINTIDAKSQYHWAKEFYRNAEVFENTESISNYGNKKLILSMPWNATAAGGEDVAQRFLTLYQNPVATIRCITHLGGMNLELTDVVSVTHRDAPDGGYVERAFEVLELTFDSTNWTVNLAAKDVGSIVGPAFFLDDEEERVLSEGDADVTNSSDEIDVDGGTTAVQVGDIIRLKDPTNEGNRGSHKIVEVVDSDTVRVANSSWTNETGITYDIIPSWLTKTGNQNFAGHLCDDSTNQFSNGDEGKVFE